MDKNNTRVRQLIHLQLENQISPAEQTELWDYVDNPLYGETIRELLGEAFAAQDDRMSLNEDQKAEILHHIFPIVKPLRKYRFSPWTWSAAASVILLLLFGTMSLWKMKGEPERYTTLIVPAGHRINLILQDSTRVWLNANTTFRYPAEFSKKHRTVYLDGQGYFEVSKNKNQPFVVKTQKGDVQVTGTKFDVKAYPRSAIFETSLFEGGVDLYQHQTKLVSLKPNEKSSIENGRVRVSAIDGMEAYLWRKGLIAFRNKKLEEILPEISQSFNVEIIISAKNLSQETFTGKFRQSDGIEYALQVLQKSVKFSYHRNNETGIIYIH